MTPEDYAVKVLQEYRHEVGGSFNYPVFLGQSIVAAIRAAVEAEREACAAIADHVASPQELGEYTYGSIASERIAAAIRARK